MVSRRCSERFSVAVNGELGVRGYLDR